MENSCHFSQWVCPWLGVLVQWSSQRLSLVSCLLLDPVATPCLVFLAAEVGGGCRTWKETWAACWLTDEAEVGGGWKLRLAGFSDHRDWLTQFSSAAPVPLSITRLVFPLKPTTLTHYKQLPGLSEPSHLMLLIQFSQQLESFCFSPWVPLNCLNDWKELKYWMKILFTHSNRTFRKFWQCFKEQRVLFWRCSKFQIWLWPLIY